MGYKKVFLFISQSLGIFITININTDYESNLLPQLLQLFNSEFYAVLQKKRCDSTLVSRKSNFLRDCYINVT